MTIDDSVLLAYVDGDLSAERRLAVEAAAAHSAELADRLAAMRASALPFGAAFDRQALPDVPPQLTQRIAELASVSGRSRAGVRRAELWLRFAAAFFAGAVCAGAVLKFSPGDAPMLARSGQVSPWIQAVADYQALYSRETLANVTEDPMQTQKVVAELQRHDDLAVQVPDLRDAGLTFKRVQRLSFHDAPVVQLVYLAEQGGPVALCITKDTGRDEAPQARQIGEMQTVAWRHQRLGYVLLAKGSQPELTQLAKQLAATM